MLLTEQQQYYNSAQICPDSPCARPGACQAASLNYTLLHCVLVSHMLGPQEIMSVMRWSLLSPLHTHIRVFFAN